MWLAVGPAPSSPSPNFHVITYGSTPPLGGDAEKVNAVAAAIPAPPGETLTPPPTSGGMLVVVVDVEVVVDVVTVTVTLPSGLAGDPAHLTERAARTSARSSE
jgi:hypothetical protein